jgi:hypothetical protein
MRSVLVRRAAWVLVAASTAARAQQPQPASVCQIKGNPAAYTHRLVQLTAFASHTVDTFTLFDPNCDAYPEISLEYGKRSKPVVIDGIANPLVEDKPFHDFDRLTQRSPDTVVHATLVGRLYAASPPAAGASRFLIQQVVAVDPQDRSDVDYQLVPDRPVATRSGCGFDTLVRETESRQMAAQREAEAGPRAWAFDDPARVAADALTSLLKIEPGSSLNMTELRKPPGRVVYEWRPAGKKDSYMVVVNRPYWLSFFAADSKKVAWVVMTAYRSSCQ